MLEEVINLWNNLREICIHRLSRQHEIYIKKAFNLARLYRMANRREAEDVLIDVIDNSGESTNNCDYSPRFKAILELCKFYESQQNAEL